jgi:hypothetical protein
MYNDSNGKDQEMARTKNRPGPKPRYGDREEIHVQVPVNDLVYIREVANNVTEWVIAAIKEKREREQKRE